MTVPLRFWANLRSSLAAWFIAGLTLPACGQEPIYDLAVDEAVLAMFGILNIEEQVEYAELAVFGGSDRVLDELMLPVFSDLGRDAVVTTTLYQKAAGFDAPGAPFWQDSQLVHFNGNLVNAGLVEVSFGGIDVMVPDELYWSVSFSGITSFDPLDEDLRNFGPTLNASADLLPLGAATDPDIFWQHGVGDPVWSTSALGSGNDATFSATFTASPVPEPGVLGPLCLAAAVVCWRRRRCRC